MKRLLLAISAVFLALPVFASSVPDLSSPYRSGRLDAKRAAVGEERLELDVKALAALRAAGRVPFTLSNFPIAPGARARLILRRFEITSPDARIRVTGPSGDTFLAMPEIAHFSGSVAGEPDSTVYLGVRPDFLTAFRPVERRIVLRRTRRVAIGVRRSRCRLARQYAIRRQPVALRRRGAPGGAGPRPCSSKRRRKLPTSPDSRRAR
jgi:hypothetical protein